MNKEVMEQHSHFTASVVAEALALLQAYQEKDCLPGESLESVELVRDTISDAAVLVFSLENGVPYEELAAEKGALAMRDMAIALMALQKEEPSSKDLFTHASVLDLIMDPSHADQLEEGKVIETLEFLDQLGFLKVRHTAD